ncbi:hypothetical protein BT63DRAFT_370985, partial [Microthyrium microscopicum]
GWEGDWTWRYRLYQWAQDEGLGFNFVGPYTGTHKANPPVAPSPPPIVGGVGSDSPISVDGTYAGGAFNSNHFAVWGRQCAQDVSQIQSIVSQYNPDLLLIELGFNDIGFFVSDSQGTLNCMQNLVNNARAGRANLKIAIANVPQRTFIMGRDDLPPATTLYNTLLAKAIPTWSTPSSPIVLVDFAGNYACSPNGCPAGHDGLHPNSFGEYQIASAFAQALVNGLGIGKSSLQIQTDIQIKACPTPSNLVATGSDDGVTITWDSVFGAFGYDIISTNVKAGTSQTLTLGTNRWDTTWTEDGWEWQYQVRTNNGPSCISAWTGVVTATAKSKTPPPPGNVVTSPTADGIKFSWSPPTGQNSDGIFQYGALVYDVSAPGSYVNDYGVIGTSLTVTGLKPGHHYYTAVEAWNSHGGGFPGAGNGVVVGRGAPPAPENLQAVALYPTTVALTWCGSPDAAGYTIWQRSVNNASDVLAYTGNYGYSTATSAEVYFLFPGVWNFMFCVTGYNGDQASGHSRCVIAPSPSAAPVGGPVGGAGCFSTDGAIATVTSTSYSWNPTNTVVPTPINTQPDAGPTPQPNKGGAYPVGPESQCSVLEKSIHILCGDIAVF